MLSDAHVTIVGTLPSGDFGYYFWDDWGNADPLTTYITGTPRVHITGDELSLALSSPKSEVMRLISEDYPGAEVTPSDTKGFMFEFFMDSTGEYTLSMVDHFTDGEAILVYVDRDVTIHGTSSSGAGLYYVFENISLKKGWNFVVRVWSDDGSASVCTFTTATQTQPVGFVWVASGN
jgi:hypothetical protein